MREFELYTRLLDSQFESSDQEHMVEAVQGQKISLIKKGTDACKLYRFDIDTSKYDFLCFFNKNHKSHSTNPGLDDLRKFCDYVLLVDKDGKLYVFPIELKNGGTSGAVEQVKATEIFMDFIKNTAERIKDKNDYLDFDKNNIFTRKIIIKGTKNRPLTNIGKDTSIKWDQDPIYIKGSSLPILHIINNGNI